MPVAANVLDLIGHTPLVRLDRVAAGLRVPVYGKCEFLNPGGSVKDRIARAILDDAEQRGELHRGSTLIEATAGNTGGTITGVGRFLKSRIAHVCIVLADPVGSRLAHMVDATQPDLDAGYAVEG